MGSDIERGMNIPKKKNLWLLVILSIVTLGIYHFVWYTRRSTQLDNLGTKKKLSKILTIFPIVFIVSFLVLVLLDFVFGVKDISLVKFSEIPGPFIASFILGLILFVCFIIFELFMAFRTRTLLNQAIENKGTKKNGKTLRFSWFFTLIFNLFYLQYEINRIIDDKEDQPKKGPWVCFILILLLLVGLSIIQLLFNIFRI